MLLAYTKITAARELIRTSLPDDAHLQKLLHAYFPEQLREQFPEAVDGHALRREIITTVLVNDTVNTGGSTFLHRLREETGASIEEIVRAQFAAREIFGLGQVWDAVEALDNKVAADVQTRIRLHSRPSSSSAVRAGCSATGRSRWRSPRRSTSSRRASSRSGPSCPRC